MESRPLRLLSIDGGGVKGLTALLILQEIFRALENEVGHPVHPYQYFDLMGGTSTGGLIVTMLGRLRMTIAETIQAYKTLSPIIFQKKSWTQNSVTKLIGAEMKQYWFEGLHLKKAVQKLLAERQEPEDLVFLESQDPDCKVFVCAVRAQSVHVELLRSYRSRSIGQQNYDCTMWEAVRATAAAPLFFEPLTLGKSGVTFVDGAIRANNPVEHVVDEAQRLWNGRPIACLLSLGSGDMLPKSFNTSKSRLDEIMQSLVDIEMSATNKARQFRDSPQGQDLVRSNCYFRYALSLGMDRVDIADYGKIPLMESLVIPYILDMKENIKQCANALLNQVPTFPIDLTQDTDESYLTSTTKQLNMSSTAEVQRLKELLGNKLLRETMSRVLPDMMETLLAAVQEDIETARHQYVEDFQTYDYQQEFNIRCNERCQGTCDWILKHDDFCKWRTDLRPSFLWLTGSPGMGKSVTFTHIVETLKEGISYENLTVRTVAFSFCHDQLNRTGSSVLSILLHQLLTQHSEMLNLAFEYDRITKEAQEKRRRDPSNDQQTERKRSVKELWSLLCHIVQKSSFQEIFLIIDGLDECERISRAELFQYLRQGSAKLKILVSSRPDEHLRAILSRKELAPIAVIRHLDANDETAAINKDVTQYIDTELRRVGVLRGFSQDNYDAVNDHLAKETSGLFLPVKLLFERLESAPVGQIHDTLQQPLTNLEELYEKLLNDIPEPTQSRRSEILKHLMYAHRPLKVAELAFACDFKKNIGGFLDRSRRPKQGSGMLEGFRKDLLLYGPLLRIRREDDTVTFVHQSAKQFFRRYANMPGNTSNFLVKEHQAQVELAESCLQLLISKASLQYPSSWANKNVYIRTELIEKHCLLAYALDYWFVHVFEALRSVQKLSCSESAIEKLLYKLDDLRGNAIYEGFWYTVGLHCDRLREKTGVLRVRKFTRLEFFSALGLSVIVKQLLTESNESTLVIRTGTTGKKDSALHLAIRHGHSDTAFAILDHFGIQSLDGPLYNGLIASAVRAGNTHLLKRLLYLRKRVPSEFAEAAFAAISTRNQPALQALVEEYGAIQERDDNGMTVLHRLFFDSAQNEDKGADRRDVILTVLFFIEQGVNINATDNYGNTALHFACYSSLLSHVEIIASLIRAGADPQIANLAGWLPLHLAGRRTRTADTIELLIKCAEPGSAALATRSGYTPLHWTLQRFTGHDPTTEAVVRCMLRHGANPHAATLKGVTPIAMAIDRDMLHILQNVYTRLDGVGNSSVRHRLRGGIEEICEILEDGTTLLEYHTDDFSLITPCTEGNSLSPIPPPYIVEGRCVIHGNGEPLPSSVGEDNQASSLGASGPCGKIEDQDFTHGDSQKRKNGRQDGRLIDVCDSEFYTNDLVGLKSTGTEEIGSRPLTMTLVMTHEGIHTTTNTSLRQLDVVASQENLEQDPDRPNDRITSFKVRIKQSFGKKSKVLWGGT